MKILSISILMLVFALTGCTKSYPGDSYDFSNSLPAYVELKSKTAIAVKEGKTFKVTVQVRTAFQEPVDVGYSITGAITQTGTVRINPNTYEGSSTVTVPVGTVTGANTTAAAQVTLTTGKLVTSNSDLTV